MAIPYSLLRSARHLVDIPNMASEWQISIWKLTPEKHGERSLAETPLKPLFGVASRTFFGVESESALRMA